MAHIDPLDRLPDDSHAAVMTRHGRRLVAHYGSAAGELAACVRGVGIVDRSELSVLALQGSGSHLTGLLIALTEGTIAVGGAFRRDSAWWCRAADEEVLIACDADAADQIAVLLRAGAARFPDCTVHDRSTRYAPIGLVGRAAPDVLAALGAYGEGGDPRGAPPCARRRLAELEVTWLLESDHAALAFVERGDANAAWQAIVTVARPFGVTRVGRDALDRYMLIERSSTPGRVAPLA